MNVSATKIRYLLLSNLKTLLHFLLVSSSLVGCFQNIGLSSIRDVFDSHLYFVHLYV